MAEQILLGSAASVVRLGGRAQRPLLLLGAAHVRLRRIASRVGGRVQTVAQKALLREDARLVLRPLAAQYLA